MIVRHPPATSTGLKLSDIFRNQSATGKFFWLDLKNINPDNCHSILNNLIKICNGHKGTIILETSTASLIPTIKSAGFICSYYIPDIVSIPDDSLCVSLANLKSELHKYHPDAISQSIENIPMMDRLFPCLPKLTWALNGYWSSSDFRKPVQTLLQQHPSIKICLVNHPSEGWL